MDSMGRQGNPPRARRPLKAALVFLGIGGLTNIAIAWCCYLWSDVAGGAVTERSGYRWPPPRSWRATITCTALGRERVEISKWTWRGEWKLDADPLTRELILIKDRAGLPLPAMAQHFDSYRAFHADRSLPLRPVWPGFAVNTILFAILAALIWLVPVLRAIHRESRGLCPACAYPVGASQVCTECGAKLFSRTHLAPDDSPGSECSSKCNVQALSGQSAPPGRAGG